MIVTFVVYITYSLKLEKEELLLLMIIILGKVVQKLYMIICIL